MADKTPLWEHAKAERIEVVQNQLQSGVDPNTDKDETGCTALHWAVSRRDVKMTQLLLEHKADSNIADKFGETALHIVIRSQDVELTQLLLEHNDCANIKNKYGRTALHDAVFKQNIYLTQMLLERKADANIKTKKGGTVLHFVIKKQNIRLTQMLLEHKADANLQNKDGLTALHLATDNQNAELIRLLLEHDADSNIPDNKGSTALHYIVDRQNAQMTWMLLESNGDANIPDNDGKTALDMATEYERQDIIDLIRKEEMKRKTKGIHLAYTAVQSKRSEVEELGRDIESMHEHDRGLESQTSLLKGQQQQNTAKVAEKRAKLGEFEFELEKLTLVKDDKHVLSMFKEIMSTKMQMRDDIQSLGKQNVEHEEAVQTLIVEQQQNAQQIASLDTKLNERREEFQALQALLAEKKSNYRELATDMGLNESEVEANIKKALVLPHILKRRNETESARKTVQSIEESMPEMVQQVDELRDANVAREHSLSLMQTKQQELAQQDAPIDDDSVTGASSDQDLMDNACKDVVARTEDVKRSENDLDAKGGHTQEVEEKASVLNDEQQQNSDQVASLETKLDETNKEPAALTMDCLSIEDENIGMKGVYTSPKKLKQLQGISKASDAPEDRKLVESKATMDHELEEDHQVESDAPEDRKSVESKATEVKEMDLELEEAHQILMEDVSRLHEQVQSLKDSLRTNVAVAEQHAQAAEQHAQEAEQRAQEAEDRAEAVLLTKKGLLKDIVQLRKQVQSLKYSKRTTAAAERHIKKAKTKEFFAKQNDMYTKITKIKHLELVDVEEVDQLRKQMRELNARKVEAKKRAQAAERRAQEAERRVQAVECRANAELREKQAVIDRLCQQVQALKRTDTKLVSVSSKGAAWKNPPDRPKPKDKRGVFYTWSESEMTWEPKTSSVTRMATKRTVSTPRLIKKSPDLLHLTVSKNSPRKRNDFRRHSHNLSKRTHRVVTQTGWIP